MSDSLRSLEELRKAQSNARQLIADGTLWLVYELPAPSFDRRSTPSLVFETETAVRRVRNFPPDWRQLADEDLFALSWGV